MIDIEYASAKAAKTQASLSRMLPNIGGSRAGIRRLLARVVASVLLYAAPAWTMALDRSQEIRRKVAAPYRLIAIRAISGFRTELEDAALVLAGMIPIDLLAREMAELYRWSQEKGRTPPEDAIRRSERAATMATWQARWDASEKGRWTHRLVPKVHDWMERERGEVNFHLTEFISGHGGFRDYLYRFRHEAAPWCPACPLQRENPQHVPYHCPRYESWTTQVSPPEEPEDLILFMAESEENWTSTNNLIVRIQRDLRRCEVERRIMETA
ncbi:hypothetical protein ACLKA6_003658 [Drosophila palustris]